MIRLEYVVLPLTTTDAISTAKCIDCVALYNLIAGPLIHVNAIYNVHSMVRGNAGQRKHNQ